MSSENTQKFGKLRSFFWPVYRDELKIFVPLLLMFFFIAFNYNILRATKDALVITAKHSGAEALPFLKTWAILPMALLITFIFTRLSNRFKTQHVFYLMMGIFLSFYLLFGFVLYPLHESLHPHGLADKLETMLPVGCHGLIAVFRNWTFTAFYVMSELWSTAIMTVLFWGFVNEITSVDAAKRLYALLALSGNLASILSGKFTTIIAHPEKILPFSNSSDRWGTSLTLLTIIVLLAGLATMWIFRWVNVHGLDPLRSKTTSFQYKQKGAEFKMGIRENFAYLARSKYLISIAVIVITYNIAINLTEVVWKDQLHELCPDPNDYQEYTGKVLMSIGVFSTLIALLSGVILRKVSWTFNALIPPLILLITGSGFFSFLLFKDTGLKDICMLFGYTPLAIGVFFGAIQNSLSRASKYTLFDATKELAFTPLNQESKIKGKAAIDGIGSRLGKSGGSIMYQCFLMSLGTISLTIPYVAMILLVVVVAWIIAVRSLGKQFNAQTVGEKVPAIEQA